MVSAKEYHEILESLGSKESAARIDRLLFGDSTPQEKRRWKEIKVNVRKATLSNTNKKSLTDLIKTLDKMYSGEVTL